jgi:mannan endo-1,4-beta-mannosidase
MGADETPASRSGRHLKALWLRARVSILVCAAVLVGAAVAIGAVRALDGPSRPRDPSAPSLRYLGVYEPDAPESYDGIDHFAQAIGRQPNLVLYYSTWGERFQADFAASAAKHGAVTLVQIDTGNVSPASVADGQYDSYLRSYASEVKAYGAPVILSFDHEMNGDWYAWGYRHSPASTFVAAWRHVVTVFREQGVRNVTWMWTINVFNVLGRHVAAPAAWWPGPSYVSMVGIDGYYSSPSMVFASLFGPTIADVRELTRDPILVAETGVAQSAGQPTKLSNLFAGLRAYGLLGLVLFDQDGAKPTQNWRIDSPSVYATLRHDVKAYISPDGDRVRGHDREYFAIESSLSS